MTATNRQVSQLMFPTSQPAGQVIVQLEPDTGIDAVPTWTLQTLNAGPPRSSPTYDQHLKETVGRPYDWSDELRFDKRSGRLVSFVLKMPEAGVVDPAIAASWLALPRHAGLPVLDDREHGFHVDPLDLRVLAEDGSALVVTAAELRAADGNSLRVAIEPDVDLLFQGGRYGGWILRNPVAHAVVEPGQATGTDEPRLHGLFRDYLTLVVEPNIGKMNDEDPALHDALRGLRARVHAVAAPHARVLEHVIDSVLEVFYPA